MKRKIGIVIILVVIIFVVVELINTTRNKHSENVQEILLDETEKIKEPVKWHANYIWDGSTENNEWMCFRKTIDLRQNEIKNVIAQIAVDSKYWLYINGEMVVREGGLKRGETRNSIYYDEVDLTGFLKPREKYNCNSCMVLGRYKLFT